jgi:TonB-linked SusC/RagA family outer membrane protein
MNLVGSGSQKKTAQYNTGLGYGYTWNNIANYQFQINSDHNFILTGITEWNDSRNESSYAYNEGFDYDEFTYYNLAAGNNPQTSTSFSQTKKMSYAARLNYSYKGRYLLTVSNRWDGASQLVDKWDSFPAVALGWRISDETFMENTASWLTNLKLRAGYGVSGNSNISPYSSMTMVESSPIQMVLGSSQVPIYVPTKAVGNIALKWEKTYSTNVGLDVGLLKNRIDLTLDWYYTDTKDVLYNRPLPSAFGSYDAKNYYTMMSNIARMTNQGIELAINSKNIVNGPFKWNSTVNFAMNDEKVKSIDLGANIQVQDLIALNLFLGEPKNTIYGYKKLGIWQSDEAEEAALYGRKPGEIKIQTVPKIDENGQSDNGVHAYSAGDRQILGSESPDWTLGFLNNFSWKNWDMSLLFTARWGQVVNAPILGYFKYGQPNLPAFYDYWTPENPTNDYPQPNILGNKDDVALAGLSIVDGSFIKVKNITLGYTLPESLAKRMRISRLRFYSTINNPFIFAKNHLLKEIDPETKGNDEFPLYKQVVFGINFSF